MACHNNQLTSANQQRGAPNGVTLFATLLASLFATLLASLFATLHGDVTLSESAKPVCKSKAARGLAAPLANVTMPFEGGRQ